VGLGGDQLQPGVEDGSTPTEAVASVELKLEKFQILRRKRRRKRKPENQKIKNKQTQKEGPEYPGEGAATTPAAGPS
jgi:ribosome-associated translation inhibitor RaiA